MDEDSRILEMLDDVENDNFSTSGESYAEDSHQSDGNSYITDSDADHSTTLSSSNISYTSPDIAVAANNINYNDNEIDSDSVVSSDSNTDTEEDESDWEDEKFGNIQDFEFDVSTAGTKFEINNETSAIDVFFKFWDEEVFNLLLTCTNNYAKKIGTLTRPHTKGSRAKNITKITREDLEKFIGLCLLKSQLKIPILRKAFSNNPMYYHPIFNYTMSGRKFEKILRCFNISEGISINPCDRLHKVSTLVDILKNKFQSNFSPYEALSLDESMLLWIGRLLFRQYIKNKKNKYGIKFFELLDLSNIFYKKKTHTTGTLRSNRKKNPKSITTKTLKLKFGQHVFAKKGPIYVSRWRDKREVLSITTGHKPEMVSVKNKYGQQKMKPKHIVEYNLNMSGIDRSDQMISYYSSPRKTIRWYKKVIFHFLDISVWDAYYLYKKSLSTSNYRFIDFREAIIQKLIYLSENIIHGNQLIKNKNIHRNMNNLPRPTSPILGHMQEKIPHPPGWKRSGYFLRCRQCTKQKKVKQTSWRCKMCPEQPPLCPGICFSMYHKLE
ncbi:piggyBac transposable element-derived protein 4-like [Aphis craccivora]|uniref:PiggyBac transposable element-derived protein 4-like n=1 Tax=Aphis craccivora TaxID=307492 RepID=A0A6G0WE89_APHCR|nr:piggyBac transposable element-derived protein 4-like [Aphis craccivora]KAF0747319.1 piggyBac transposable element-derived protein 4-like [Aphis craccivora]